MMDDESESSQERWLVSYADFITLLFAFFTVLYATSVRDLEKTHEFQESIKRYLIKAAGGGGVGEANTGAGRERLSSPIESPIPTYQQSSPLSKDVLDEATEFIDQSLSPEARERYVMDVMSDEIGVRVILSADSIFDGASSKFRPDALEFLKGLGRLCAQIGRRTLIEGHYAGTVSPSPIVVSDWEVAALRATAMARFFNKVHKVEASLLLPMSLGGQRPWPGEEKSDSAKNRRLEIVFLTENLPF